MLPSPPLDYNGIKTFGSSGIQKRRNGRLTMKYLKSDSEKCIGCGTCMNVCSRLYFKEENPERSAIRVFTQEGSQKIVVCNQKCRLCVQECPVQALTVAKTGVVVLNKNLCVGCLACVAVCPIGAMQYFPGEKSPFKCVACGACAKECPADALEIVAQEE